MSEIKRVVSVGAHSLDAELLGGPLLIKYADEGAHVTAITVTRGRLENGTDEEGNTVLEEILADNRMQEPQKSSNDLLDNFIATKRLEGRSEKTMRLYRFTISKLISAIDKNVCTLSTEDIRNYLSTYQTEHGISKDSIDNMRRNLSSFYRWLEDENYIFKSPLRRIHKIKTNQQVKEVISDEDIEKLRDHCSCKRDLAMIDLLYSTGIRVGELVNLNISDVDFEARECVVFGKGGKERRVYFDAKAKLHLQSYIESRNDDNPALFVTLDSPNDRLKISGVEIRIRQLGRSLNLTKIHPHKFRRTMATRAIDKGMPIEQVQKILGHSQIDTTMQYAMVNQSNVKSSHRKYIS